MGTLFTRDRHHEEYIERRNTVNQANGDSLGMS